MQKYILQPQEVEVFYIIPSIRSYMAKFMRDSGKSQKEIAELLGLRESTVSQYINKKRANIHFDENIENEIRKTSRKIKSHEDVIKSIQYLLKIIKKSKCICMIHHQISKDVSMHCSACYGG